MASIAVFDREDLETCAYKCEERTDRDGVVVLEVC
jgi:hypothetical protein